MDGERFTHVSHMYPTGGDMLVPLGIYFILAVLLVALLLLASWWLGAKRPTKEKRRSYESGIIPSGSAQFAYPVPFYLVAIFFIVFDVEAVFIFTWGIAWDELGMPGLIHITFFIVVLLLGLIWLWKRGGLDWGPSRAARGEHRHRSEPQS